MNKNSITWVKNSFGVNFMTPGCFLESFRKLLTGLDQQPFGHVRKNHRYLMSFGDLPDFYASVEVTKNPSLRGKPVAVCGDPERRHGVVLAATKEAKAFGIKTGMVAGECSRLCPNIVFVGPI